MHVRRLIAPIAIAGLLLAGCGSSDPVAKPTPTKSATVVPTPSPTVPVAPVMPEAAKAHTKAGAEAFITYFWEVIEFAQLTGDVQTLKALASPMCRACNAGVAGIEKVYVDGGHIVGASLTVRSAKAISLTDVGPAVLVRAQVVVNSEPSEAEYGSLKESVPFRGGVARYEVTVVSTSANPWTVSEVTPRD